MLLQRAELRQIDLIALNIGAKLASGETISRMPEFARHVYPRGAELYECARHREQLVGQSHLRLCAIERLPLEPAIAYRERPVALRIAERAIHADSRAELS